MQYGRCLKCKVIRNSPNYFCGSCCSELGIEYRFIKEVIKELRSNLKPGEYLVDIPWMAFFEKAKELKKRAKEGLLWKRKYTRSKLNQLSIPQKYDLIEESLNKPKASLVEDQVIKGLSELERLYKEKEEKLQGNWYKF